MKGQKEAEKCQKSGDMDKMVEVLTRVQMEVEAGLREKQKAVIKATSAQRNMAIYERWVAEQVGQDVQHWQQKQIEARMSKAKKAKFDDLRASMAKMMPGPQ